MVCVGRAAHRELLGIQCQPNDGDLIIQHGVCEQGHLVNNVRTRSCSRFGKNREPPRGLWLPARDSQVGDVPYAVLKKIQLALHDRHLPRGMNPGECVDNFREDNIRVVPRNKLHVASLTQELNLQPKPFRAGWTGAGIARSKADGEQRIIPAHFSIEASIQAQTEALHCIADIWVTQDAGSRKAHLLGCQMKSPGVNARISVQAIVLLSSSSEVDDESACPA